MNPYAISIDRNSKTWAIFDDGLKCVREFQSYSDEKIAIAEGKAWVKEHSSVEPEVVYPCITKMRMR